MKDTPDLLKKIDKLNQWPEEDKSLLFSLGFVALYPNISVELVFKAMNEAF